MFGVLTREQQLRRRVEDALVGLGFADRETVEAAAQHDREEARVAALGPGDARHLGPGKQRTRAQ